MKKYFYTIHSFLLKTLIIYTLSMIITLSISNNLNQYFVCFLSSFLISTFITNILYNINKYITYIFLIILGILYTIQISSIYNTGLYIHSLTLSNITFYQDIGKKAITSTINILILYLSPLFFRSNTPIKINNQIIILIILIIIFLSQLSHLPLPIKNATNTIFTTYFRQKKFTINQYIQKEQQKLYYKNWIVKEEKDNIEVPNLKNKNIIVFFVEGFSTQQIDLYNKYKDLTPNISSLISESISFSNYFNHTAATYRGLRGQLTSSFQYNGGVHDKNKLTPGLHKIPVNEIHKLQKNTLISLPEILNEHNYNTYFISPHDKKENLNISLKLLGFDKVFTSDDYHNNHQKLKDEETINLLKQNIINKKIVPPFFVGVYNIGTHYGAETNGKVYPHSPKQNNTILNNLYNYDYHLGNFINFIKQDKDLASNTVIIITTDHATFQSQTYRKTFNDNRNIFFSTIPFIIYHKDIKPRNINAEGKNSLDFAPTLLHMLNIKKAPNYFLGCSIFENKCPYIFEYILNEGNNFYTPIQHLYISQNFQKYIKLIKEFYHLSENIIPSYRRNWKTEY